MADRPGAEEWVPDTRSLPRLREAAESCRGCELWVDATQVVFSAGPRSATVMLVGEQPGDVEDREGEPFVGPAGRVLDDALQQAGIDRTRVYLTNAVKHFRHEQRGKRRIHQKPAVAHIEACRPWLESELAAVRPDVVVCLGATAGRAVLGRPVRIGAERGTPIDAPDLGVPVVVTSHPSSVLRTRDRDEREAGIAAIVDDLRAAAGLTGGA
ncbi:UdgX family uracil-DNA binding protein [Aeromicrobium terrae]|uniref:Type-4 uracil-DNA glycosylase n=1 Tax=Aeromicrobium terrae TaxID=2498846 RepID=A0A5C8NMA0_9ACTN|nr:UdgX family uracil-DNA binding protein [Aeromicrobium terrae]TXL61951.1 UdgX family uracil-DNA binding protein [Aeromicrobium terrae]